MQLSSRKSSSMCLALAHFNVISVVYCTICVPIVTSKFSQIKLVEVLPANFGPVLCLLHRHAKNSIYISFQWKIYIIKHGQYSLCITCVSPLQCKYLHYRTTTLFYYALFCSSLLVDPQYFSRQGAHHFEDDTPSLDPDR